MLVLELIMLTDICPILDGFHLHLPSINGQQMLQEWRVASTTTEIQAGIAEEKL